MEVALLAKADLATTMVSEFPDLQGIIGSCYIQNKSKKVVSRNDKMIPNSLLDIADRIDTLNAMFSIGIRPTSTKDPYAVRIAAISVNRILSFHNIRLKEFCDDVINQDVIQFIQDKGSNKLD